MIRLAALLSILILTGCTLAQQGAFDLESYGKRSAPSSLAGNGSTDDTVALQALIDAAVAAGPMSELVIPPGMFRVSHLDINGANGLSITQKGLILGMDSGSYESVVTIRNSSDVQWHGKLWISARHNPGYACGLAVYANGTQASNMDLYNPAIVGAAVAMRFGRASEPHDLVSEITVHGGFTYGCPTAVEAYGTQTVLSFVGSKLISNLLGGGDGWGNLPQYTIRAFGAHVSVSGGCVQHNQTTDGACLAVEPISDPTYGNNYGTIQVFSANMETAARLGLAQNTLFVPSPAAGSGGINIQGGFGYHSQNAFPFIETESAFSGRITLGSGCNFYAPAQRTYPNMTAHGGASISVEAGAFGHNFQSPP